MDKNYTARRRRDLIIAAVLAALAALAPLFVKDVYIQNILVLTLMYAALSQSWNILSGYCGQISLGHALYFGIGAYTTELLFTKFGVLPWFGMLAGGAIAAAHRDGARLSLLPPARPLLRDRDHRHRRDRAAAVPELGMGGGRDGHHHSGARRQLAEIPVHAQQAAVFLFRAGALLPRLVRHLVAGRLQMGFLVARGEGQSGRR